jgi:hypothetical protein
MIRDDQARRVLGQLDDSAFWGEDAKLIRGKKTYTLTHLSLITSSLTRTGGACKKRAYFWLTWSTNSTAFFSLRTFSVFSKRSTSLATYLLLVAARSSEVGSLSSDHQVTYLTRNNYWEKITGVHSKVLFGPISELVKSGSLEAGKISIEILLNIFVRGWLEAGALLALIDKPVGVLVKIANQFTLWCDDKLRIIRRG